MSWKTYSVSWNEWVRFCTEHNEDPHEIADLSFETSGGDGYTVTCRDDPDDTKSGDDMSPADTDKAIEAYKKKQGGDE